MVGIREIPRTATFAWSPGTEPPILATGTKAGAVDEGFSNDTQLELWHLDLEDQMKVRELQPAASISTDSRFNDIAWTTDSSNTTSRGVIAGALENGALDLWDATKLLSGEGDAFISRTTKHSGSIKALQFNTFRSELLATVGAKGELFISDVNNVGSPFRMGNAIARADDFECLDWNKRTSHIMVTGSNGGTMTVWDIKNKRESLTLNNLGRKPVSAVAWDPIKTTRLITAIPNDTDPVILVWDLRNANAPERVLKGHDGGILSLSWCQQDNDLLLSCGKDNRTICWNPQTGESHGEFSVVTNWTFQTRWSPQNPNFMATASFDGKISMQSIQNTRTDIESQASAQSQTIDDEDFFNKAQPRPHGTTFTLLRAPKWLQRPCGAMFGFGGKIVTFKSSIADANKRSLVRISTYVIDDSVVSSTESFEASLQQNDLNGICDNRIAEAIDDTDASDWKVIKTLTSKNPRKDLVDYLGFSSEADEAADGISKLYANGDNKDEFQLAQSIKAPASKSNRLSAFFDNSADGDSFLSELAATKAAKTNSPFQMYTGSESESDQRVTRALLLGEFEKALDVCLQERRMSDAFMIAICGGQSCIETAQKAYFNHKEGGPNYLRILASVVGKNLWDLVHNADLQNWKEIMVTLCTYADVKEFPDLCEALGDRLEEQIKLNGSVADKRKDAAFCYLAGSKLEKVITIWLRELQEREASSLKDLNKGSAFSIHTRALQGFIEKVTIFRRVTHYEDDQQSPDSEWRLAPLYDRYMEYADIASAHAQLQIAERYLDLLPSQYAAAGFAKSRIMTATREAAPQATPRQPTAAARGIQGVTQRTSDYLPYHQQARTTSNPALQTTPYTPPSISQMQNPYMPAGGRQYGGSGHAGLQQAQQVRQQPSTQPRTSYSAQLQNGQPGPPPRSFNTSPSIPPPSKDANIGNWNDMPESFFKPPIASRRGTPSLSTNGLAGSQSLEPPPVQQIGPPPRSTPPVGAPTRMPSQPTNDPQPSQQAERPLPANPYAPSQLSLPVQQQSTVPRGHSPYNAPPTGPPPSNRYTPSQPMLLDRPEPPMIPGNGRQQPPPLNPHAPPQNHNLSQHNEPPLHQGPPPSGPPQVSTAQASVPPQRPPQGSRPSTAQSQRQLAPPKYREYQPK